MKVSSAAMATVATLVEMNPFAESKHLEESEKIGRIAARRNPAILLSQPRAEAGEQGMREGATTTSFPGARALTNNAVRRLERGGGRTKRCDPDAGILDCRPDMICQPDREVGGICARPDRARDPAMDMTNIEARSLTLGKRVDVGDLEQYASAYFTLDLEPEEVVNCFLDGETPDANLYAYVDDNRVCASTNLYFSFEQCDDIAAPPEGGQLDLVVYNAYSYGNALTDLTLICDVQPEPKELTPGVKIQVKPLLPTRSAFYFIDVVPGESINCTLTGDTPDADLYAYFDGFEVCSFEFGTSNEQCLDLEAPEGVERLDLRVLAYAYYDLGNTLPLTDLELVCGELAPSGKKGLGVSKGISGGKKGAGAAHVRP